MIRLMLFPLIAFSSAGARNPYDRQVAERLESLRSRSPSARARAAEALGFLRAHQAEEALVRALHDPAPTARRNAALALRRCGGRAAVAPLLERLDAPHWTVAQAAWVALTNLTAMDLPFDALALPEERRSQAERWHQ